MAHASALRAAAGLSPAEIVPSSRRASRLACSGVHAPCLPIVMRCCGALRPRPCQDVALGAARSDAQAKALDLVVPDEGGSAVRLGCVHHPFGEFCHVRPLAVSLDRPCQRHVSTEAREAGGNCRTLLGGNQGNLRKLIRGWCRLLSRPIMGHSIRRSPVRRGDGAVLLMHGCQMEPDAPILERPTSIICAGD